MTFAGKIFTVLIVVFSLVLMGLSLSIWAAHKNWRAEVMRKADAPGGPGYVAQIEKLKQENEAYKNQFDQLNNEVNSEKVARRVALAKAETARLQWSKEQATLSAEMQKQLDALAKANTDMTTTQSRAITLAKENDGLRGDILKTQQDRDVTFQRAVALVDSNHQLQLALRQLGDRTMSLMGQLVQAKQVLFKHNLDINKDVANIAPPVDGVVTGVRRTGQDDLVSVSIGDNDGIKIGHYMDVYRGDSTYVGRIVITTTKYDVSVGESLPKMKKRPFQVGDIVRTVVPTATTDKQANTK